MKGLMLAAFAMSAGLFAGVAGTPTASAMVLPAVGTSPEAIAQGPVTKVQYPPGTATRVQAGIGDMCGVRAMDGWRRRS